MARQVIDDRILEQTATSGVDDITLTGALDSFNSFSSKLSNAEECIFCIEDSANNAYEISKGTYTSATNSLSRDSVLSSSNSDAKVAFQAGNKRVFLAYSAEEIKQYVEGSFKNSVRVASTENIALSTGIANSSVIDGITIATNDRVALLGQIDSTKNGVWIAQSSGMPIRATDFDNDNKISAGLIFNVEIGTNAGLWKLTTPGNIVLETTNLTFSRVTEQSNNNDYDVAATSDLNALIPTVNGKFRYEINNPTNAPSGVSGQIFVTANRQGQDLVQIIYDTDAIYIRGGRGTYTSSWVNLNDVGLKVISTDSTITGNGTSGSPLSIANEFTSAEKTKLATIASGATRTELADDLLDPANFADGDVFICDSAINNITFGSNTYNFAEGAVLEKFGGAANSHWSDTGHSIRLFFRGAWVNLGGYHAGSYVTHSNTLWFARTNIGSNVEPNDTNTDWQRVGGGATSAQVTAIAANTAKRTYPSGDQLKLAGIEAGATADQTAAEIATSLGTLTGANRLDASAVQNLPQPGDGGLSSVATGTSLTGLGTNADPLNVTNPFTDADETKLDGIATGATVGATATQASAITDNTAKRTYPSDDETKLAGIETGATVGATTAQETAISANTAKRSYPQTDETKLDGIASGATVGATPAQASAITNNTAKRTYPQVDETKLAGIETAATADQTASEIVTSLQTLTGASRLDASAVQNLPQPQGGGLVSVATGTSLTGLGTNADPLNVTNPFTDADETKLDGIAAGAEVNVQSDWNALAGAALILNKPAIPTLSTDTQFETGTSTTLAPQVAQVTRATEAVSQLLSSWDGSSNPTTSVQVGPLPTVTAGTINTSPYDAINDRFIVSSATGGNSGLAYQARLEWSNSLIDWRRTAFCYDTEQEAGNWQLITYFGTTSSPNNINQNASGGGFGVGIFRVTNPADTYLFALTPYIGSGGSGGEIVPTAFFNGAVTNAIPGDLVNFNGFNITETNPRMRVMIVRNERVISFYVNRLLRAEFTLTPAQNTRATGSRYGFFGDGGNAKRVYLYGLSVGNPALSLLDRNCLPLEGATPAQATAITANTAKRTYPSADETKVAGIATGATVGATAAQVDNYIHGFSYGTPNTSNLTIQPGACRDSTNTRDIVLSTAIVKNIGTTFTAGNNQGGRIGSSPASTVAWWKIYAIVNAQGVADVAYTPVGTTLVLPTGFVASRRIGFFRVSVNSQSSHSLHAQFFAHPVNGGGLRYEWDNYELDATLSASTETSLQVVGVPVGYELDAILAIANTASGLYIRLESPLTGNTTIAASSGNFTSNGNTAGIIVRTNTSAQIYVDTNFTNVSELYRISTKGFIDRRQD